MVKQLLTSILRFLRRDWVALLALLVSLYGLLIVRSSSRKFDILEKRIQVVENVTSTQFDAIQKSLESIDAHLAVLDQYASADWSHFHGIENNINIDSKTKTSKKK